MDTLGVVELRSIAAGVEVADGMLKAATVELLRASTICSGRYLIFVAGRQAAVATAVAFAQSSNCNMAGSFIISGIAPEVLKALQKSTTAQKHDAVAVIESRIVSAAVMAADAAVKRSAVSILRLVSGQGINGKAYFVLGGDIASVTEATAAAKAALGKHLIEAVVLPRPEPALLKFLTGTINA